MTLNSFCMNSQQERTQAYEVGGVLARRQTPSSSQYFASGTLVKPILATVATVVQPQKVRAQEATPSGFVVAHKLINMTGSADTPLRRSEAGIFRDGVRNVTNTAVNDDEEERRQARRRTLLQESSANDSSMFEENETLKKCLEIYNGNKLSKENAWSVSLIDTLSSLLERHHKSLNNFKVAGSSLEASSRVYGLRVDSVHTDVLRISAGLNAQKFVERQQNSDDEDVATGGEGAADPNASAAGVEIDKATSKPKQKRVRRVVHTVTKNKETLNARLDTVPLQDPVFGKLNSIVGSINASNRLMNNILPTIESELRLRTTFNFWNATDSKSDTDFTIDEPTELSEDNGEPCDRLMRIKFTPELQFRPLHTGYVISDTPEVIADERRNSIESDIECDAAGEIVSMAFDINAECEPVPPLNDHPPMLDVDYNDFDELTTEERTAINNCRGLRKPTVLIEDMRPVDASSKLEYSYRPLDKISQFWAGPSHWKFKRIRPRSSTQATLLGVNNQRGARRVNHLTRKRSKQLQFEQEFDEAFMSIDKFKSRKANFPKKWDQRKLKLPTDLQLDTLMFKKFQCAPTALVQALRDKDVGTCSRTDSNVVVDGDIGIFPPADEHFGDQDGGGDDGPTCSDNSIGGANNMIVSSVGEEEIMNSQQGNIEDVENIGNNTILEISNCFDGAPTQVTKIIVPFAKRAKVIDMKNLKRCCTNLINKQMKKPAEEEEMPKHPIKQNEQYEPGIASFKDVYTQLPSMLTQSMTEALSPSVAFYSMLHLANDFNLRLIPQVDLEDFKIRQLAENRNG